MNAAVVCRQVCKLPVSGQRRGQVSFAQGKFKASRISAAKHSWLVIGYLLRVEVGVFDFADQGIRKQRFFIGCQEFSDINFSIVGVSPQALVLSQLPRQGGQLLQGAGLQAAGQLVKDKATKAIVSGTAACCVDATEAGNNG